MDKSKKDHFILGIETTCDETACSIVKNGTEILSNVVVSQIDLHSLYGGVYPELACRRHLETIIPALEQCLKESTVSPQDLTGIAVAKGPGLIGALLIGLNTAKTLSLAWNKPLIGVNHVEAHLYAAMMNIEKTTLSNCFPAIGAVLSGGHTFLVRILKIGCYEMIGATVDDAIGEAFDKVAVLLGLPYPGGPEIEKLAQQGDSKKFPFKRGVVKRSPWDFSFSGLKTNVLYNIKGQNSDKTSPSLLLEADKAHIAASFQETALGDVADKIEKAAKSFECNAIFLGGGVTQNKRLRQLLEEKEIKKPIFWPSKGLSLDNGAMIAGLGYHLLKEKKWQGDSLDLEPMTRIPLVFNSSLS